MEKFTLSSPDFNSGENVSLNTSFIKKNLNPDLIIKNIPSGTNYFALIFSEVNSEEIIHWILWDIPLIEEIHEGCIPLQAVVGINSYEKNCYVGPKNFNHRYVFTLYALKKELVLSSNSKIEHLLETIKGNILGIAKLDFIYSR